MKPSPAAMTSKTNEERKYLEKYFYFQSGCGKKPITENEYIEAVMYRAQCLNIKQKALDKMGLDELDVSEIQPVCFEGFEFNERAHTLNRTSSKYCVTWLFFSSTQIYIYEYSFDMTSNDQRVRTEEYFYKDVTNFSFGSESKEVTIFVGSGCTLSSKMTATKGQVDTGYFGIIVPGDKLVVPMHPTDENERIIQEMKQKLREKKG